MGPPFLWGVLSVYGGFVYISLEKCQYTPIPPPAFGDLPQIKIRFGGGKKVSSVTASGSAAVS